MKDFKTDFAEGALILAATVLVILFEGEPDLMDAILYHLTAGKITLPVP